MSGLEISRERLLTIVYEGKDNSFQQHFFMNITVSESFPGEKN